MGVDGTYKITVKTPMGIQEGTLALKVEGGVLSGTLAVGKGSSEFTGGTVDHDSFTLVTKVHTPLGKLKATVSGAVEGDRLTGTSKIPLGTMPIEGTRVVEPPPG